MKGSKGRRQTLSPRSAASMTAPPSSAGMTAPPSSAGMTAPPSAWKSGSKVRSGKKNKKVRKVKGSVPAPSHRTKPESLYAKCDCKVDPCDDGRQLKCSGPVPSHYSPPRRPFPPGDPDKVAPRPEGVPIWRYLFPEYEVGEVFIDAGSFDTTSDEDEDEV